MYWSTYGNVIPQITNHMADLDCLFDRLGITTLLSINIPTIRQICGFDKTNNQHAFCQPGWWPWEMIGEKMSPSRNILLSLDFDQDCSAIWNIAINLGLIDEVLTKWNGKMAVNTLIAIIFSAMIAGNGTGLMECRANNICRATSSDFDHVMLGLG